MKLRASVSERVSNPGTSACVLSTGGDHGQGVASPRVARRGETPLGGSPASVISARRPEASGGGCQTDKGGTRRVMWSEGGLSPAVTFSPSEPWGDVTTQLEDQVHDTYVAVRLSGRKQGPCPSARGRHGETGAPGDHGALQHLLRFPPGGRGGGGFLPVAVLSCPKSSLARGYLFPRVALEENLAERGDVLTGSRADSRGQSRLGGRGVPMWHRKHGEPRARPPT